MTEATTEGADALVEVTPGDDGVTLVELVNGKANTMNVALLDRLFHVAVALAEEPPGAVVVTGRGRMFAAGAEISQFGGPDEARHIAEAFHRAFDAVAAIPRPVIAAVNGFALGGGCELALACDLRVAADSARLGLPEILLGILPGGGGTQRLPRLIGPGRAKDLMMTGRQVRADEALAMGLVDRVVPADELLVTARALAVELASGPSAALALVKRAVDGGLDLTLHEGLALERELFEDVFGTDDARIGVQSFLEHGPGKASFTGR